MKIYKFGAKFKNFKRNLVIKDLKRRIPNLDGTLIKQGIEM
jgi:hypothetical protein